jgi:hypothetical protein
MKISNDMREKEGERDIRLDRYESKERSGGRRRSSGGCDEDRKRERSGSDNEEEEEKEGADVAY